MEVSSPPTSFDQLADTAFLLQSGTDPSSLPHFPALLLPFHKITGGGILPAVFFGAIADAISGAALYHLTLQQTQSTKNAVDVATMFLWNPLTIASCISGSTDSLRLCALFLAAACAAAGKSGLSGGCLALVLHFSTPCLFSLFSSPVMLMAIPLVALACRNHQQQPQKNTRKTRNSRNETKNTTAAAGSTETVSALSVSIFFLIGFLVMSSMLTLTTQYLISRTLFPTSLSSTSHIRSSTFTSSTPTVLEFYKNSFKSFEHLRVLLLGGQKNRLDHPWSNIEPNLGLQWYLFSEVLPPFRYLYDYIFWAVSVGLCFSIALRFATKNPIAVLVGQSIVLCMLCQHPTYSDIMVWLGFLPVVLMEQNQWQENKENEKDGEEGGVSLLKPAVRVWFAIGFCISLGLNTAAYELWLTLGTGNANFFYVMNLVWAAWQALALVQLLKSTAAMEDED